MENDGPYHDTYLGNDQGKHAGYQLGRVAISRHGNASASKHYSWTSPTQNPAGGVVIGMSDGHVEYSKLPNLWQYKWHRSWGPAAIGTFY